MKRVIATTITLAFPALAPPQEFGHVLGQPAGFQRSGSFGPAAHDCRDEPREGNVVGDVGARLRIERRPSAHARAVFDATGRWLIVLAGYPTHEGQPVRDGVDETYVFREVVGTWPFGDRWEGDATIELYSFADEAGGFVGFGFHSVGGRVQLFARELPEARDSAAVVLQYRSMQKAFTKGAGFDDVERTRVAEVARQSTAAAKVAPRAAPSWGTAESCKGNGPRRVRPGPIRKIYDVHPVWPEAAQRARVQGTVIIEITIAIDGSVTDPRILRGSPLLNDAAIESVRQWRYEPVLMCGNPIPMHMPVVVNFR